ncbi:MAG TPA: metallophosphoesterase family protein [Gaiellaceae bacterium]|nr:metallophosphoesterase family protein [Gaiellaceae bacterium]
MADVDGEGVDEIWCLGDVVGYGPRPNECCDLVRERVALSLCGNHDLAVIGSLEVTEFAGDAGKAARWTAGVLGDDQRAWLGSLQPLADRGDAQLFHASPRDPVWEYVLSEGVALAAFVATEQPVVLVGHSHVALALSWEGNELDGGLAPAGTELELRPGRRLMNPGSVGQPRDGDPRAAWLLLDFEAQHGTFRRVVYDVEATQTEIRARGLPESLAARLQHGI